MKVKQTVINIVLLLLFSVFQFSLPLLRLFGAAPFWLLAYAVCLSVSEPSPVVAVVFSAVAGMITDFSSGGFFGHNTLWFIVTAYLSVFFVSKLFSRNFKTAVFIFSVGMLIMKVLYYLMYAVGKKDFSFFGEILHDFLPVYLLSLPVLVAVYFIYSRFYYRNPDVRVSRRAVHRR